MRKRINAFDEIQQNKEHDIQNDQHDQWIGRVPHRNPALLIIAVPHLLKSI
jgi:hypothetical protein